MKFCTNCGAEIADESKFCSNCGVKYEEIKNQENSSEEVKSEYDEMWGAVLEKEKGGELNIKYEDDAPYAEDATYGGNVVFQMPDLQQIAKDYEMPSDVNAGNGNMGISIAAMVCGIVSLVCCCLWYFIVILAIAAIVMGIISIKKGYAGRGMAIAGLVTGGITIFALIVLILLGGATAFFDLW